MTRRARQCANARPWEMGEEPETGDWSDGTGEGDDDQQESDDGE